MSRKRWPPCPNLRPRRRSPPRRSRDPRRRRARRRQSGADEVPSHWVEVTAPIVGTFYGAPAPDAPSYVKAGDRVEPGTVLCIIEAMKLMNEIEAETSGVVREVLVRNEEPVEYGQVLFRIEPA